MCVEICRSLFCIIGNFNEFPIIQKSLRAGSHCGGGERKAQALISFGVARKGKMSHTFWQSGEMSGGQKMVQIKMFFPAKQNLFSRKGS